VAAAGAPLQPGHRIIGDVLRHVEPLGHLAPRHATIVQHGRPDELLELVERHQSACGLRLNPRILLPHDAKWRVVSKEDVALLMHELYAADAMDPEIVDLLIECRMPLFAVRCSLLEP